MNPQQHYATYTPQPQQFYGGGAAYATQSGGNAPLHAWTPPSPQEQQHFDMLFALVDEQRRNAVGGQQAVAFFTRSHLDKAVLREIWGISDTQRRSELSRNEFYVAMRLISMAQRGEQLSVQRFMQLAAMQYPLPMMEGVPPPQGMHPPAGNAVQSQGMQPVGGNAMPTPQVQTQTQQKFAPPQASGAYAVTPDEKSKYDVVFQQYDTDRDGFLLGPEAVALFQMSGLDRNVLRDIWSMADVTQDSKLSIQEFYVAMHLIVCVSKRGLPMPPTLPRELGETAFGASGASQGMPGHDAFGSQASGPKSQNGFGAQQQQHESVPPPKPEGMSAFDSLSTVEDAPLPSLASSTPRSSRANSFNHTEATASTSHAGGFGEPSVPTPTGSLHGGFGALAGQQDSNNFGASRTPSVTSGARSERTNSASSMNSMSSFSGMAPLPPQVPQHQLPPRNLGSNERIQMPQVDNAGFQTPPQAYSGFGAGGFGAPQAPVSEKPFMGDDDEKSAVRQLDQQNEEVVQTLANVERKQTAIEMLSDKLRDLDELRHELVTLVMKREDLRVFSATASATTENYEEEQTRHAVEHSLRSLVENQKQFIHQLQCDISRHEGELEEAILSAKLQQKLSLESRSPLINATSPRQSIHDSLVTAGGEANAFPGAPLSLDGANALPSPIGAPSAPSVSAFSADATDSSGFNAFSNFDSAPRSIGSATPSPAAGVTAPSGSPFSPTPSPSQSASANTFGDFAAAPLSADATPDVPAKSPAAASDAAEFDAFGAAPISASSAAQSSSPAATSDVPAISPFSPFSPSPSPAATDDSGFGGFGDFNAAPSASPAAAIEVPESSPFSPSPSPAAAAANSSSGDFGSTPDAVPSSSPTTGVGSSPFSSSPSPADVDAAGFEAFASAPLSSDSAAPPAEKANATENLIFSPVAPDSSKSNAFGDFSADPVSASSATSAEPTPGSASTEPPTGNLLFSPEPSPPAATSSSGFDAFGDFGAPPASTDGVASAPADKSTGSSPFSPAAVDNTDFNGFGDFNAASTSADSTSPSSAPEKQAEPSGNSPFSPAAENASNSGFEAFGDFNAAPVSTDAAATPSNLTKAADASGSSPFSPVAADNSGFDGFGDFNSASATTATSATTSETTKPAESSGNSPFSPVATDNSGFEAFGDFNAAPSTTDSKPANSSDSNSFEAFGDFNAAPTATDNSKSAKDSSDSTSFAAFGDFSAAPSSTSGSDAFGDFK